jgi:hypothetical protein
MSSPRVSRRIAGTPAVLSGHFGAVAVSIVAAVSADLNKGIITGTVDDEEPSSRHALAIGLPHNPSRGSAARSGKSRPLHDHVPSLLHVGRSATSSRSAGTDPRECFADTRVRSALAVGCLADHGWPTARRYGTGRLSAASYSRCDPSPVRTRCLRRSVGLRSWCLRAWRAAHLGEDQKRRVDNDYRERGSPPRAAVHCSGSSVDDGRASSRAVATRSTRSLARP